MKANPEKCHFMFNEECRKKLNISDNITGNIKCKKSLWIKGDCKLNFEAHVGDNVRKQVVKCMR